MKWQKTKSVVVLTILIFVGWIVNGHAAESVEWSIQNTLQIGAAPIDVAVTSDGRRIFVLTDQGDILIYSASNKVEAKIPIGKHVDSIKLGPRGNTLILGSRETNTVEIITLDFIYKINVSGSPFKGIEGAPVVIAVFNDFQ